jgi:hypothetical protein
METPLFEDFPYVCPEPVLLKRCIFSINMVSHNWRFRTGCQAARFQSRELRQPAVLYDTRHAPSLNFRVVTSGPSLSW